MNTSFRNKVWYWIEDHGPGLAMLAFVLIFGALVSTNIRFSLQDESYAATVTKMKSQEEKTTTENVCNGDPVLLICSEEEVTDPAWYRVELTYSGPAAEEHEQRRGKTCSVYVDQDQYQAIKLGMPVEVQYRTWDGCSVKAWASATA